MSSDRPEDHPESRLNDGAEDRPEAAPGAAPAPPTSEDLGADRDESGAALGGGVGAPGDPATDPFALAGAWLEEAKRGELNDANAMSLATADAGGTPDVRIVLLKEIEPAGSLSCGRGAFVFYTNFQSAKGRQLEQNARAAIVLHWKSLRRQLRARGRVERVGAAQADAYFASRAYASRVGAWASRQSAPLSSRGALVAETLKVAARHPLGPPRPPHWGGYRLIPDELEFWSDGAYRLHDRWRRVWRGDGWTVARLNP